MKNTTLLRGLLLATVFLALSAQSLKAQNKLLTIDDIFDPVKKVNFNGTTPTVRWLKDGNHYLLTNEASRRDVPRLQKVNAATGEAVPFFDAAKMQAAFAALPGVTAADARQLGIRLACDTGHRVRRHVFTESAMGGLQLERIGTARGLRPPL